MDDFQARNSLKRIQEESYESKLLLGRNDDIIVELKTLKRYYQNKKDQLVEYLYRKCRQLESKHDVMCRSAFGQTSYAQRHEYLLNKQNKTRLEMDEVIERMQYIIDMLEDDNLLLNNNLLNLNQQFNEIDQILYQSNH